MLKIKITIKKRPGARKSRSVRYSNTRIEFSRIRSQDALPFPTQMMTNYMSEQKRKYQVVNGDKTRSCVKPQNGRGGHEKRNVVLGPIRYRPFKVRNQVW